MEDGWMKTRYRWNQDENETYKLHQVSSVRVYLLTSLSSASHYRRIRATNLLSNSLSILKKAINSTVL